jgi:hypothetical protein
LLEEEGHSLLCALIANVSRPFNVQDTRTGTAFAACDDPMYPCEVHISNRPNKRLDRKDPNSRWRSTKMVDPGSTPCILH